MYAVCILVCVPICGDQRSVCLLHHSDLIFFEAESLIELGAYPFDWLGWPVSSKDLPVSSALALGLQA